MTPPSSQPPTIIPNTQDAVAFLDWWAPEGPWTLTAITPDKKSVETRAFEGDRRDAMEKWIKSKNGLANLYFMVNPVIRLENKKAKRDNVKSLAWLHVDIDPRKLNPDDKTDAMVHIAEEKARNVKRLMEGHGGLPVPSLILDSGGGVQAFWRLSEPEAIDGDEARYEDLKRYNKAIEVIHDADDCHNVDRIMRLPGTVNLPDAKKKKAGRKPALASVLHQSDDVFDLTGFKPAPKADADAGSMGFTNNVAAVDVGGNVQRLNDVDELPEGVGDYVKMVIVQGQDPDNPGKWPSGSEVVWWVVNELVRCDVPDEMIFAVITDPDFDISAHVLRQSNPRDYAKRQIGRAKPNRAEGQFAADGRGHPYPNLPNNIRLAVKKLGVELSYDEFSEKTVVTGIEDFGPALDDSSARRLWFMIDASFKFLPQRNLFHDVILDLAKSNSFHPVRDYLSNLKWDGKSRIGSWLIDYAGAQDTKFNRAVGELALIAAVRRIRRPGVKFDEMLVLESEQGANKSTALKILAVNEDWFLDDSPLNADAKRIIEMLTGKWIVEASELNGIHHGGVDHLKSFLSRTSDKARMAYDRYVKEVPRQFLMIGTTNDCHYLHDATGNRRFWPVKIVGFNITALQKDRDQLWAEAAHRESSGVSIRLEQSLWPEAAHAQNARKANDPFYEELLAQLGDNKPIKVRAVDVWGILRIAPGTANQTHNKRVGQAMRSLGFERTRSRVTNSRLQYVYLRRGELEPEAVPIWEPDAPSHASRWT